MNVSSQFAIECFNLSKEYTKKGVKILALDDVNIKIKRGEIYGLLGENGAGKTTFVRAATTMIKPTSGSVKILGLDTQEQPEAVRRMVGVLPQEAGLYEEFTVWENLIYFARLNGIKDYEDHVTKLIELIGMQNRIKQRADSLSGGLRRRVALARTLIGNPKVLFLDEPTTGLDVLVARKVRAIIKRLAEHSHATVVLSTHNMWLAEKLCTRIGILNKGRMVAEGTPQEIIEKYRKYPNDNLEDVVAQMIGFDNGEISMMEELT
jgi:ABC-type multidrug transport system ATPase subunit